jgi:hypothetical protein
VDTVILPGLDELGEDLVGITPFRRRLAVARPFLYLTGYAAAGATGHWFLAAGALFLMFCADISLMHDAVHGTVGLRRRGTDWVLFAAGASSLSADTPTGGHTSSTTRSSRAPTTPRARPPG